MFFRHTAEAKVFVEEKNTKAIKEKYGYENIYLTTVLGRLLCLNAQELLKVAAPKEALIVSGDDGELIEKLAALDKAVENVYIFHTLVPKPEDDPFFVHGLERVFKITEIGNLSFTPEERNILNDKKLRTAEELYEEAGKVSLTGLFSVTHRICMAVNLIEKTVDYKDPYGREIPADLKDLLTKTLSIPATGITSHPGQQQHPEDHSNCTLLSFENLISLKEKKSFLDLRTDYVVKIQEIRKKYGDYLKPELEKFLQENASRNEQLARAEKEAKLAAETPSNDSSSTYVVYHV